GAETVAWVVVGDIIVEAAAIHLLEWAAVAVGAMQWTDSGPSVVALLLSIVCGVGLLQGSHRARKVMMILAGLSAAGTLLVPIIDSQSAAWPQAILRVVYMAGIVGLLAGERASIPRILASVAAVFIAWGGNFGIGLVEGINSVLTRTGVEKYTLADRVFSDEQHGISLELPPGWSLLTNPNPEVKVEDAKALALHRNSGCLAA